MSDLITYDDKVRLKSQNVSEKYKVTASDMNEIKSVVNTNADEVGDITTLTTTDQSSVVNAVNELNAPEKWVSVGETAPTDGERVWFEKSKNLLKIVASSQTINGITFTQNSDGSISAVGTATADAKFQSTSVQKITPNKDYFLSGCPSGGSTSTYRLVLRLRSDATTGLSTKSDIGDGLSISATDTTNANYILGEIWVYSGQTVDLTFYPMFEEGSTATTYEAYVEPAIYVDEELLYQPPVVLWTNSDTTSSFASQTITLSDDISNYSYYEVIYLHTTSIPNDKYSSGRIPVGSRTRLLLARNTIGYRIMSLSNATATIQGYVYYGTYGNSTTTTDNTACIPYQILGYK